MSATYQPEYEGIYFFHLYLRKGQKAVQFYRLQSLCSIRCRVFLKLHLASGATKGHPPKTSITLFLVNRTYAVLALNFSPSLRTLPPF